MAYLAVRNTSIAVIPYQALANANLSCGFSVDFTSNRIGHLKDGFVTKLLSTLKTGCSFDSIYIAENGLTIGRGAFAAEQNFYLQWLYLEGFEAGLTIQSGAFANGQYTTLHLGNIASVESNALHSVNIIDSLELFFQPNATGIDNIKGGFDENSQGSRLRMDVLNVPLDVDYCGTWKANLCVLPSARIIGCNSILKCKNFGESFNCDGQVDVYCIGFFGTTFAGHWQSKESINGLFFLEADADADSGDSICFDGKQLETLTTISVGDVGLDGNMEKSPFICHQTLLSMKDKVNTMYFGRHYNYRIYLHTSWNLY